MAMAPEKFRELFASLQNGTSDDAAGVLDHADALELSDVQRGDVLALKYALQKIELRKQRR